MLNVKRVPDERTIDLGSITVTTGPEKKLAAGFFVPANKTITVKLVATVDADSIEIFNAEWIEFAYCTFKALYDQADLGLSAMLYTDSSVEEAINAYLKSKGYDAGKVGWSEMGRQESGSADLDMHFDLIEQFWPDLAVSAA